jgi:hypothetical protein
MPFATRFTSGLNDSSPLDVLSKLRNIENYIITIQKIFNNNKKNNQEENLNDKVR